MALRSTHWCGGDGDDVSFFLPEMCRSDPFSRRVLWAQGAGQSSRPVMLSRRTRRALSEPFRTPGGRGTGTPPLKFARGMDNVEGFLVAPSHAPQSASRRLPAHDREPVRDDREFV